MINTKTYLASLALAALYGWAMARAMRPYFQRTESAVERIARRLAERAG